MVTAPRTVEWVNEPEPRHLARSSSFSSSVPRCVSGDEREIFRLRDGAQKREDMIMNKETMKRAVVIAIAGAVALGAVTTASAAPVLSSTTALNNAAPSSVINVRHYRHYRHYGPGLGLGVLGAAAAVV